MTALSTMTTAAWVFSFLFTIYMFYYFIFTVLSLKKSKQNPQHAPETRFAIVIAARNEGCVIGQLVESLMAQNYPRALYEVFVVPNNCTDDTRMVAEQAGARIIDCRLPVKSKGEVLKDTFEQMFEGSEQFDAVCIFDADNLVHPDFLQEMNNAYCEGAQVAQGYRDSKNPYDTTISSCYSIYYWMVNRLYNHSRNGVGLSAMINGSGFMVSMRVLKDNGGWHTQTMTEDIEFTTQCILRGERVAWAPQAIIYDEQPLTFAQSWIQRKRWSTGILQGLSLYFGALLRTAKTRKSFACVDQMLFFLAPVMQLLYVGSLLLSFVLDLLYVSHNLFPQTELYYRMFVSLNFSYIMTASVAVFTIIIEKKSSVGLLKGVAAYWLFILSWVPINVICFFKKCTVWQEIKHTRAVRLSEVRS